MSATYTQESRRLAISTPLGDDVLLLNGFSGDEELSQPFCFQLDLFSESSTIAARDIVGKNVTFFIEQLDGEPRYFNGYVRRFAYLGTDDRLSKYTAEVVPWLWFLTRNADCRLFQQKSAPEIIESIFKEMGFTDFEFALKETHPVREYCVQYRECDFNFVSRLMEEEGIFYFFKHENGKHALVMADHAGAYTTCGESEVDFAAPTSAPDDSDMILSWEHRYEYRSGRWAAIDYNFETPSAPMLVGTPTLVQLENNDKLELYDYPGGYVEKGQGEAVAKIRMEEEELAFEVVNAASKCRTFTPGGKFTLAAHHARSEAGKGYVICTVRHSAKEGGGYTTGGTQAPLEYVNSFTCIPDSVIFRPQRETPKPVVHGSQTAVVVGPDGEEIYTDKYGRVKVHFHWDRYNKPDENGSCWIRVAQLWAGNQWGAMFIPRIGQEVVVDFLEGDPDRPIITGRVYHAESMPPHPLPDNKTISSIKSYSSPGGEGYNEIRFEDKKDKEQVFIHAQRRMDMRVRGSLYETNYGNREVRVGWEKDGDKGGDLNTLVQNDVNTHFVGGQFELVDKDENRTIEGEVVEHYKKSHSTKVEETARLNSKEFIVETGDVVSLKTKEVKVEASDTVGLRGGTINLESTTGVSIKCGGNFVVIDSSGVSINGTMLKLNSGGSASAAASGAAAEVPELELPFDAAVADDGVPGKKAKTGGSSRSRKKVDPGHIKAPDWKPPPPPPGLPVPPVIPVGSDKPCGIKDLTLCCCHKSAGKQRAPDPGRRLLQVVPKDGASKKTYKVNLPKKYKISISGTKEFGGDDTLTLKATSVDGSNGDVKTLVKQAATPPDSSEFSNGATANVNVKSPACDEWWPNPFTPEVHYCYGKGCDEPQLSYTVEAYPSLDYTGAIEIEKFEELLKKLLGKEELEIETRQRYGFSASLTGKGPTGTLEAKWGWRENSDWRAYFGVQGKAAITFVTVQGRGTCNLRDILTAAALTFAGVPFNASMKVFDALHEVKLGDQKVLDILSVLALSIGLEVSIGLEGSVEKKFFATGEVEASPALALKGGGKAFAELKYRQGPPEFLSATLIGQGEAVFEATGDMSIEADGVYLAPALDFKGMTVELSFEFRLVTVEMKHKLFSWEAMAEKRIWPQHDDPAPPKWRLLPPGKDEET